MAWLSVVIPATDRPTTLQEVSNAIKAASEPPEELIIVELPARLGPAAARNLGASQSSGDLLVFVDADVKVHADVFQRIRSAFAKDPSLTAVFGSYDDEPEVEGVVSQFRNLLHHHVHHDSAGRVATFWAGLGAIRRDAFMVVGGFDEARYQRPSVEDIDLGLRLTRSGYRIELDPAIQGTHLKAWSLRQMLHTDFVDRGVPWVELLLRERSGMTTLNLGWRHRLSAAAAVTLAVSIFRGRPVPAAGAVLALVALNARFYGLISRKRGPEVVLAVGLHALHHLAGVAAVPAGLARFAVKSSSAQKRP